jgi:hypothetical protein
MAHAQHCQCRPIPESIKTAIKNATKLNYNERPG